MTILVAMWVAACGNTNNRANDGSDAGQSALDAEQRVGDASSDDDATADGMNCEEAYGYAFRIDEACRETRSPEVSLGCLATDGLQAEDCWMSPEQDVLYLSDIYYDSKFVINGWTRCDESTFGGVSPWELPVCD